MKDLFKLILGVLASLFKSRARLEAEILILRQQINVLRRQAPKRPHLNNTDRFLFVWLYHWFSAVVSAIAIVRPETIIRWHRERSQSARRGPTGNPGQGFRPGIPGRVPPEIVGMAVSCMQRVHVFAHGFYASCRTARIPAPK